jgi:hypothetical protein
MSYADPVSRETRRIVLVQAALTVVVATGFGFAMESRQALAALYGGGVTIGLTLWLAWRVRQADRKGMAGLFSGAIARYALAALGVGAGIGLFRLPALPLLCAFAVTQFGFVVPWRRP